MHCRPAAGSMHSGTAMCAWTNTPHSGCTRHPPSWNHLMFMELRDQALLHCCCVVKTVKGKGRVASRSLITLVFVCLFTFFAPDQHP